MLLTVLRIKNEEKYIERCLKSVEEMSEKIYVFDDHSTDNTAQICKQFNKVDYELSPFKEGTSNEVDDKNYILTTTLKRFSPTWILSIDGDEEMPNTATTYISSLLPKLERIPGEIPVVMFKFLYFWNSMSQYRNDGIYANFWQARMWKVPRDTSNLRFESSGAKQGYHCGSIPINVSKLLFRSSVPIKHYGYVDKETRMHRYVKYNTNDKNNFSENRYMHIIYENGNCFYCPDKIVLTEYTDRQL